MIRCCVIILLAFAAAAQAQVGDEDAAHREDRLRTEQLNRDALRASEPIITYRSRDEQDYQAARARYQRELAAWRRRVAACQAGDWSACE